MNIALFMKTEHYKCPSCQHDNKVTIPENFEEKLEDFASNAPTTAIKALGSYGVGVFFVPIIGFATAGILLAKAIYNDGTIICGNKECGERFRIRSIL
jgi:hypothetical protein